MKRARGFVLSTLLLLIVAGGCKSPERKLLDAELARLLAERDRLADVAEHLDEYKPRAREVVEQSKQLERMGAYRTPEDLVQEAARLLNARGPTVTPDGWVFDGYDEAWPTLCHRAGALPVRAVTFGSSGMWTLSLSQNEADSYGLGPIHWPVPPATPPLTESSSRKERQLHEELRLMRLEIAELERLAGPIGQFDTVLADMTRRRPHLSRPSRVHVLSGIAHPLFLASDAPCAKGSLVTTGRRINIRCTPAIANDTLTIGAIEARVAALRGWNLTSHRIETGAAERVRLWLTVGDDAPWPPCPSEDETWSNAVVSATALSEMKELERQALSPDEKFVRMIGIIAKASGESTGQQALTFASVRSGLEKMKTLLLAMNRAIDAFSSAGGIDPRALASLADVRLRAALAREATREAKACREGIEEILDGLHRELPQGEHRFVDGYFTPSLAKAETNLAVLEAAAALLEILERSYGHWESEGDGVVLYRPADHAAYTRHYEKIEKIQAARPD